MFDPALPGTPGHQALLQHIIQSYADDDRVVAIGVLGSLARETWDEWSDLDLDIVTNVGARVDPVAEAETLCRTLGHPDALIVGGGREEVDVVLPTLEEFSIRYHPLGTTNAHITKDLRIVAGRLDRDAVLAAGVVHTRPKREVETVVSEALRYAITVDIAVRRRNMWQALRALDELRWRLEEVFALTHAHTRPAHAIDALATPSLQRAFMHTLPRADKASISQALNSALDLLETAELTERVYTLTPPQHKVLSALRTRPK